MVVFLVGAVAVAGLLVVTTQMHLVSANATEATSLGQQKLDQLMKLDFAADAAVQLSAANTLTANTANYFDTPQPTVVRRWSVQPGPTATTRLVTVRTISGQRTRSQQTVDLITVIRQW